MAWVCDCGHENDAHGRCGGCGGARGRAGVGAGDRPLRAQRTQGQGGGQPAGVREAQAEQERWMREMAVGKPALDLTLAIDEETLLGWGAGATGAVRVRVRGRRMLRNVVVRHGVSGVVTMHEHRVKTLMASAPDEFDAAVELPRRGPYVLEMVVSVEDGLGTLHQAFEAEPVVFAQGEPTSPDPSTRSPSPIVDTLSSPAAVDPQRTAHTVDIRGQRGQGGSERGWRALVLRPIDPQAWGTWPQRREARAKAEAAAYEAAELERRQALRAEAEARARADAESQAKREADERARQATAAKVRVLSQLEARAKQEVAARAAVAAQSTGPSWRRAWMSSCGEDTHGAWAVARVAGLELTFRYCPPGRFTMGSPEHEVARNRDESPQHEIDLPRGVWVGETQVTQRAWMAVMGGNPSCFVGPDRPVENVSWSDCSSFIGKLNALAPGLDVRLPTEAEWEYACRAGTTEPICRTIDDGPKMHPFAWFDGNSEGVTHPVRQKAPNAWGLHDMLGNVWEWCADWYGRYEASTQVDPTGPEVGVDRVARGGAWNDDALILRPAYRLLKSPDDRDDDLGLRLARGG